MLDFSKRINAAKTIPLRYKNLGGKRASFKVVQSFITNDKANKTLKSQC